MFSTPMAYTLWSFTSPPWSGFFSSFLPPPLSSSTRSSLDRKVSLLDRLCTYLLFSPDLLRPFKLLFSLFRSS
ncbi:unnamed protein product [Parajaminaea phylloscopi]